MASAAPIITPIFATPVAVVASNAPAALHAALASLFLSRATEEYRDAALPPDARCFRSREDLFDWPSEPVAHLRQQMLRGLCSAVMAATSYTEPEFNALGLQARARFAIVRPDGCIPASTAPMASWYALYCVAAPPPAPARADSGVLRLYATRPNMFHDASNYQLREPFAGSHQVWRPVSGQMAVFPASILHEVALNRTDVDLVLVEARVRFAHGGQEALPPW
jgi:hypothetical protein